MKLQTAALRKALAFVLPFVSRSDLIAEIAMVHFNIGQQGLVLTATDLNAEARANPVECIGKMDVCVPPALLKGFCERAGEEIDARYVDGKLTLKSGKTQATIKVLDGVNFPKLDDPVGEPIEVKGIHFSAMIDSVAHASARNDIRPVLNGVLLQSSGHILAAVASDGMHMSISRVDHDCPSFNALIPIGLVEKLPEFSHIEVYPARITAHAEGGVVRCKLMAVAPIDWIKMDMVKLDGAITCNTEEFRAALRATEPFQIESKTAGKYRLLRMECDGSTMRLSGGDEGSKLVSSLDADGSTCDDYFNAKFWSDVAKADLGEEMTIRFGDRGMYSVEHGNWREIIMKVTY